MSEVVVALDLPSPEEAFALVERLGEDGDYYKVGFELFILGGPPLVRRLREMEKRIFLDLKLHDIPNTVRSAARAAAALEVDLLTVHAAGGGAMIGAAVEGAREGAGDGAPPRVVAVTILTSLSGLEVREVWGRSELSEDAEVVRLANLAMRGGAAGVVASPREAQALRKVLGPSAYLVTPGIRPAGASADDQRRIATPGAAVAAGADLLVVGRSITRAEDPAEALRRIRDEMNGG